MIKKISILSSLLSSSLILGCTKEINESLTESKAEAEGEENTNEETSYKFMTFEKNKPFQMDEAVLQINETNYLSPTKYITDGYAQEIWFDKLIYSGIADFIKNYYGVAEKQTIVKKYKLLKNDKTLFYKETFKTTQVIVLAGPFHDSALNEMVEHFRQDRGVVFFWWFRSKKQKY